MISKELNLIRPEEGPKNSILTRVPDDSSFCLKGWLREALLTFTVCQITYTIKLNYKSCS